MKKHVLCLGDSNTHGYCADPNDNEDGGFRYNENERWTCLLQKSLGEDYLVTEEGLSGRTTVFVDPLNECMDALTVCYPLLKSHEFIDLLIIMLGTNDTKARFSANAINIGKGMERLVLKAKNVDCWGDKGSNILIIAPPPITDGLEGFVLGEMGDGAVEKSEGLAAVYKEEAELLGCHFLDANGCEFNNIDHMHLTKNGHRKLADILGKLVPTIV